MTTLDYRVVDAFTWQPFGGNPAGVILDAAGLSDAQMQLIAREINLSETTFILPPETPDAAVRFRWFTPGLEVTFCGHATLAAVHALQEEGRFERELRAPGMVLPIQTRSGILTIRTEYQDHPTVRCVYWLDMPNTAVRPARVPAQHLVPMLGVTMDDLDPRLPPVMTTEDDVILVFKEIQTLLAMQPDFTRLAEYGRKNRLRGILVSTTHTLTPTVACHSRFFAPAAGINEDPVTGSVHGPLCAYLVEKGVIPQIAGKAGFQAAQGEPGGRAGILRIVVTQEAHKTHVRIGGACATIARGTMLVPPTE